MSENNDYFDEDESLEKFQGWFHNTCFGSAGNIRTIVPDVELLMKDGASSIVRDLAYRINSGVICTVEDYIKGMVRLDYSAMLFLLESINDGVQIDYTDEYTIERIQSLQQIIVLLLSLEDYFVTFINATEFGEQLTYFILRLEYMLKYDDDQYTFFPLIDEEPNAHQ